jgi:signal transduction histidine kinase
MMALKKIQNSILTKALIIVILSSALFIVSLQIVSSWYLQGAFRHIDEASLENKAAQLDQIYDDELNAQNQLLKNWSVWDDMYGFVQKPTKSFFDANMGPANMADLVSHFVFIFDNNGKLVASSSKTSENNDSIKAASQAPSLKQEKLAQVSKKIDATAVVEKIGSRYIVLALHPIVKSDKSGDVKGVVVFARWLDESFFEHISKLFGVKVALIELPNVSDDFQKHVSSTETLAIKWIDKNDQTKQAVVYPEGKNSLFALGFEYERVFYKYGLAFLGNLSIFGTIFILFVNLLLFWLLREQILKRLVLISSKMELIEGAKEKMLLPKSKTNDEIGHIVKSANAMLNKMYGYQEKLATRNMALEVEVKDKVDELRAKDAALFRQSRFVTIGETIANISHQWRQPLNDLWLVLQSLSNKYKNGKLDAEKFDEVMTQSRELISHMSDTIEDFQSFFKPDKEKVIFFVNDMLKKAISIVNTSFIHNEIVLKVVEEDRFAAYGVPNEFAQAVLNILNNAKDALVSNVKNGRKVEVELLSVGGMIVLSVADNAGGIDEKVIETIFEPYITTKDGKGGTGIGLYITKQVIGQCDGGDITAENIDGGARFTIILNEHGQESFSV